MFRRTLLGAAGTAALVRPARAWQPDRPLRLVVPFAAGGPTDLYGRVFAQAMSNALSQPVIVENRAGSGGVTGLDAVAKSPPNGLTLGMTTCGNLAIAPAMPSPMPYDPMRDVAHISMIVKAPEVLAVRSAGNIASVRDLIAAAKANPGGLQFGSSGVGSITHLACELLAKEAGLEVVHVPYRSMAPAVTDLLAGRVHFVIADLPGLAAHFTAGTLRPLAITSARRLESLPDVATTAELGLPGVLSDNWNGLGVPAATPRDIQDALFEAAGRALRDPVLLREFAKMGVVAGEAVPREEYLAYIRAEAVRWAPLVRATGADIL
ncbi:Bug family tripartite tricarboxylate transporter substrate binding protein [Muricoccus radiodurans]|uniref:Bug family tripartite tricarboxylate transporter substrate binding protein n=1 Tax=Muricoccus radiodurans TaxID=2231721 RepID=UPI003CE94BA3